MARDRLPKLHTRYKRAHWRKAAVPDMPSEVCGKVGKPDILREHVQGLGADEDTVRGWGNGAFGLLCGEK